MKITEILKPEVHWLQVEMNQHDRLMWWVGWDIKIGEIRHPLGSFSPISQSFIAPNGSLLDLGAHLGKAGNSVCWDCSEALAKPKTRMRSCLRECSITQRGLIIRLLILSYRAKAPSLTFTATCISQQSLLHELCVPVYTSHLISIKVIVHSI